MDFVITANQRSGTTAFGSAIGQLPRFIYHGECFSPKRDKTSNFFHFLKREIARDPDVIIPQSGSAQRLFDRYRLSLEEYTKEKFRVKGNYHLIKINYNNYYPVSTDFQYLCDSPFLMDYIKSKSIPILHIVRKSLLEQAVSSLYAQKRGFYHSDKGDVSVAPTFAPDPQDLLHRMRRAARLTNTMRSLLKEYPRAWEISYEDLFENNGFSDKARAVSEEWLGMELDARPQVAFRKVTPPLRQIISNADAVVAGLAGTEFEAEAQALLWPVSSAVSLGSVRQHLNSTGTTTREDTRRRYIDLDGMRNLIYRVVANIISRIGRIALGRAKTTARRIRNIFPK